MKKRITNIVILLLCLLVTFTGCNPNPNEDNANNGNTTNNVVAKLNGIENLTITNSGLCMINVVTDTPTYLKDVDTDNIEVIINGKTMRIGYTNNLGNMDNLDYPDKEWRIDAIPDTPIKDINSIYVKIPLKDGSALTADYKFNSQIKIFHESSSYSAINDPDFFTIYGLDDYDSYDYYLDGKKIDRKRNVFFKDNHFIGNVDKDSLYLSSLTEFGTHKFYITQKGETTPVSNVSEWKKISGIDTRIMVSNNTASISLIPHLDPKLHTTNIIEGNIELEYQDESIFNGKIVNNGISLPVPTNTGTYKLNELAFTYKLNANIGDKKITQYMSYTIPMFSIYKTNKNNKFQYTVKCELNAFNLEDFNYKWSVTGKLLDNGKTIELDKEVDYISCNIESKNHGTKPDYYYQNYANYSNPL